MTKIVENKEQFAKWAAEKKMELINELDGLKVGDKVTFTNDYGCKFHGLFIIGIDKDNSFYGKQIHLNTDSYWFPHSAKELTKEI